VEIARDSDFDETRETFVSHTSLAVCSILVEEASRFNPIYPITYAINENRWVNKLINYYNINYSVDIPYICVYIYIYIYICIYVYMYIYTQVIL